MTADPLSRAPTAIRGLVTPARLWFAGLVALLVAILIITQTVVYIPLNPEDLQPQAPPPPVVWINAIEGGSTRGTVGPSTGSGSSTLVLGNLSSGSPASSSWTVQFPDDLDFGSRVMNYTLYLPGTVEVSSNLTPISVGIAGRTFPYQPSDPTMVAGHTGTVYTPRPADLAPLPLYFRNETGNYLFLAFPFQAAGLPVALAVNLTLPGAAQAVIPYVVVAATADLGGYHPQQATPWALLLLPLVGAIVVALLWVARKLKAGAYAGLLALGVGLRLALAPAFLHSDLETLMRYPQLFFNDHLLDLQSWGYGVAWLGQTLLPPVPLLALGIDPTVTSYDVLLKVPGIVADALVFLLLIRLLTPRLGEERARRWALVGWLFNPLVIYFSAIHGLPESTVALGLLGAVWGFQEARERWGLASLSGAVLVLINIAITWPVVLLSRWLSPVKKAALLAVPVALYLLLFESVYGSLSPLWPYTLRLLDRGTPGALQLGVANTSGMTFLLVLGVRFGLELSPWDGLLAVVVGAALMGALRGWIPRTWAALSVYGAVLAFYLTYEAFYIQHVIWIVPLLVLVVALSGASDRRGWGLVAVVSLLALVINFENAFDPIVSSFLAFPFFALLLVPAVLAVHPDLHWPRLTHRVRNGLRWTGPVVSGALVVVGPLGHLLSAVNDALAALVFLAFLGHLVLAQSSFQHRWAAPMRAVAAAGVIILPPLLWFNTAVRVPVLVQGAEAVLTAFAMAELAILTTHMVGVPSPHEATQPPEPA